MEEKYIKATNSDGEIRPCLSHFKFYIGQTGHKEDNPLLDFNRLKDGSELGFEFTISGLNRVLTNDDDNNISLIILYYERVGQVGFKVNNLWGIHLDKEDMKNSYKTYRLTLTKTYLDLAERQCDMYLNYPLVKIMAFQGQLDVNALDENTLSNWMTWSQHNELLCVKIPMIPKAED